MESKKSAGPVIIHFANPQEAIDLAIRIELKYFLAKLLYSHYNRGSIIIANEPTRDPTITRDSELRI